MVSSKPSKQRKHLYNASLQERREIVSSHLSKELRAQYKRRSLPLRRGDEVKIMNGEQKGKIAKVSRIDMKDFTVYLEGITEKRTVGTAVQIPFHSSNLMIISPDLNDEKRRKILLRKVKEVKVPEKKPEPKKEEKKAEPAHEHVHAPHEGHEHHVGTVTETKETKENKETKDETKKTDSA